MRLTSIEIFGFKSFPHRTKVLFDGGIAAVVGPNGCGKSNIGDAFRWALGEQSAKSLRGGVMEDLIFNGTAETPPLSLAEVSLTFAECAGALALDADEVVVTRRMYRSGESHYYLNGRPVRLKDVRDLFADTGLGKASYAVIEQGMVESIVRAKADERRDIFEEAAGIRGYRAKRAEAVRKLDDVQANMERVEDLYAEYQRQSRALKRQAGAARRYQGLVDRHRHLDLALARAHYGELGEQKRAALARRDEAEAAHRAAKANAAEAAAEVAALGAQLADFALQLEEREQHLLASQSAFKEAEAALTMARERRAAAAVEVERLRAEAARWAADLAQADEEEERIRRESTDAEARLAVLEAEAEPTRGRLGAAEGEEERLAQGLEAARAEQLERYDRRTRLSNRHAGALAARESLAKDLLRLRGDVSRTASLFDETRLSQDKLAAEKAATEEDLAECRAAAESLAASDQRLLEALAAAEAAASEVAARRENVRSRLQSLEELARRFESFSSGVAALMAEGAPEGVHGLLADAVKVREGFEVALERALGLAAGAILVKDARVAAAYGRQLAAGRAGRAAFITPVGGEAPARELPVVEGARGWAADFVSVAGEFESAVKALLAGILVVDDLAALEGVAALYPQTPAVTLAGDWWDGRALMLAGSADDAAATILGRRAEMARLAAELETLEREVERTRQNLATLKTEREELALRREENATRAASLKASREALDESFARAQREGLTLAESVERLEKEAALTDGQLAKTAREEESVGAELAAVEEECIRNAAAIAAAEESLRAARAQVETTRATLARAREEGVALRARLSGLAETRARVRRVREQGVAERERLEGELTRKLDEAGVMEEGIAAADAAVAAAAGAYEQAQAGVKDLRLARDEREARRREVDEVRNKAERAAEEIAEAVREHEVGVASLAGELHALDETFAAKYDVRLSVVAAGEFALDEGQTREQARGERDELGQRLAKMGEINFLAAREYDDLTRQLEELDTQRADLAQARTNLDQSIARIDAQSREVFLATFERIRGEFQGTFRQAFGGGQADLKLEAGADPLDAGIYIYAQPPGKKMEHLSLLSGGEKALTAIALLFALFNVKPAPFAILDEVDAPLDEHNIGRFTRLVSLYRDRVQFMVITHARRTMEAADAIYGITMERRGISKVLSLHLEEVPEEFLEVAAAAKGGAK